MAIATLSFWVCNALADEVVWVWQALGKQHDCEGCDLIGGALKQAQIIEKIKNGLCR